MTQNAGNQRELRRGTLELAVLHLLTEKDRYGYELVVSLSERTDGFLAVKEGTLYPVLYRLEENNWVQMYWQTAERGNPRKYYRITDTGSSACQELRREWLEHVEKLKILLEGSIDES
jgi:PadR family transcriptional regulator PadR